MSRITQSDFNSGSTVGADYAMGVGADAGRAVESVSHAPELTELFGPDKAYSDQRLERLARRFGLPFNVLGQPDVDAIDCLDRSAEFVTERKYVSAKKVLEIGMNDAVNKGPYPGNATSVLRDLAEVLKDFIRLDDEILGVGNSFSSDAFPRDFWSLGIEKSFGRNAIDRELSAYGWECELEELKVRVRQAISGNEWITPLYDAALAFATALTLAIDRDLSTVSDI